MGLFDLILAGAKGAAKDDRVTRQAVRDLMSMNVPKDDAWKMALNQLPSDQVGWTPERVQSVIDELSSGSKTSGGIAWVNPQDFVNSNAINPQGIRQKAGELDFNKLTSNPETPFVSAVDGGVQLHEGRHRMQALADAGVTRAPIAVKDMTSKYPQTLNYSEANPNMPLFDAVLSGPEARFVGGGTADPNLPDLKISDYIQATPENADKINSMMQGLLYSNAGKSNVATTAAESFADFVNKANSGSVRQARNPKESFKSLLSGESNAQDFDINDIGSALNLKIEDASVAYEMGDLNKAIKKALEGSKLVFKDDMNGRIYIGKSQQDIDNLSSAKTPIDFGKSYGYSDNDIASFYVKRRGGDMKQGYQDYLSDLNSNAGKSNVYTTAAGDVLDRYQVKDQLRSQGVRGLLEDGVIRTYDDAGNPLGKFNTIEEAVAASVKPAGLLDTSYRGSHQAPDKDYGAPFYDLTQMIPEDVYGRSGERLYGFNDPKVDRETFGIMRQARGNPQMDVPIYRAVPPDVNDINIGDWVTPSREYAKIHGENALGGNYKILEDIAKAEKLYSEGYPYELGLVKSIPTGGLMSQIAGLDSFKDGAQDPSRQAASQRFTEMGLNPDTDYSYASLLPVKRAISAKDQESDMLGGYRPAVPGLIRELMYQYLLAEEANKRGSDKQAAEAATGLLF